MKEITKIRGEMDKTEGIVLFWSSSIVKALKKCLEALREGKQVITISGIKGCGKTELMSLLEEGLIDVGFDILSINIPGSLSSYDMLLLLGKQLNINFNPDAKVNLLQQLHQSISTMSKNNNVLLFVDNCEKLKSKEFLGDLKFLVDNSPNLSILLSGRTEFLKDFADVFSYFEDRVEIIEYEDLREKESSEFVNWLEIEIFKENYELLDWTKELIAKTGENNPGKLRMLTKLAVEELQEHKASFKEEHLLNHWNAINKHLE